MTDLLLGHHISEDTVPPPAPITPVLDKPKAERALAVLFDMSGLKMPAIEWMGLAEAVKFSERHPVWKPIYAGLNEMVADSAPENHLETVNAQAHTAAATALLPRERLVVRESSFAFTTSVVFESFTRFTPSLAALPVTNHWLPLWWLSIAANDPYKPQQKFVREAFGAGAWLLWITKEKLVVVPVPELKQEPYDIERRQPGRIHCDNGPAVTWPGEQHWFWRGVRVTQDIVERPETITVAKVGAEPNAEVRRVMIERMGAERFMREGNAKRIHRDKFGTLWHRHMKNEFEPFAVVEVVNGTPEPDGSIKHYWLRVPPTVSTAREAVAWTYGMTAEEYDPEIRT